MTCFRNIFLSLSMSLAVLWSVSQAVGTETSLERAYRTQAQTMQEKLDLSSTQSERVSALLATRLENERHLRRQMRTTYTPVQQRKARELWLQRDGRSLTEQERKEHRRKLGVTEQQERQFEAYQVKLQAHREQTLIQAGQYLVPSQQVLLADISFSL